METGSRDGTTYDPGEIAVVYDELIDTYEMEWNRQGHHSLHMEWYDEDHTEPGSASINTMRVLSEAANVEQSDRILNIGCGIGEDSVWNARAYGATVIGLNISESQLERARENARAHGVEDLTTFRFDDFHEMDTVEGSSVDLIWGLEALSHSPDRRRVLEQARRVLADDGRVAFTDLFLTAAPPDDQRERIRRIRDGLRIDLGTIDDFADLLRELSFSNVEIRDGTEAIRPCTRRRYKFARLAHPLGRLLGVFGVFSATQLAAFKASADIHKLVEAGLLGYYVITADVD